jgi:hypothetical protein
LVSFGLQSHPPAEIKTKFTRYADDYRGDELLEVLTPHHFAGFCCGQFQYGDDKTRVIVVPHWSLALGLAILPSLAIRRKLRQRSRIRRGECVNWGYDLRATPDRCPECGAEVSPGKIKGTQPNAIRLIRKSAP